MKKSTLILSIISVMTLCLTACGKPNMSFQEAIDNITHSEVSKMMTDAEIYEQNFNISSDFSMSENNIEANINFSTNSKQNKKDSEGETKISRKINAALDDDEWRETIILDGDAMVKYLSNAIYFKLNSLNIDGPKDFNPEELGFDFNGIKTQWFSFELTEEILDKIKAKLPEDFDINKLYNKENHQKTKENLQKLEENLKKAINNEGSIVYNGIYSEFNRCNAYKFSIDKKKAFDATTEYIKTLVPEVYMDDYTKTIEETNIDEIFEDLPFKNFEGYLVIIGKDKVQIVIENLDIENDYSTTKLNATFGIDKYELAVKEDGEESFVFSANLNEAHYDIVLKANDQEIIKGIITPKFSQGKFSVDFDLSINFNLDEKISIPLKGGWSWEEITKFNVERPTNSKNLLENIIENIDLDNIDPSAYLSLSGGMKGQILAVPVVAGGILAVALTPRMQAAQGRARDVARKADLSQLQSAIITSQGDNGMWPGMDNGAAKGITVNTIEKELNDAGLISVPMDPIMNNINNGLGKNYKNNSATGEYLYLVTKRNGVNNGGFILMAKTEVEGGSNWIVCKDKSGIDDGYIASKTDISDIKTCYEITKGEYCSAKECKYTSEDELRYILIF